MTTPIPSGIGYGTVRWTVVGVAEDDLDADNLPDADQINGKVTFRANPIGGSISATSVHTTVLPRPVTYPIVNGKLQTKQGNTDIRLVGNDSPDTNPTGWSYTASYELNDGYTFDSFDFYLATGQVVELADEMPVGEDGGVLITRGPAGQSAYESAVEQGFVGTEAQWLASLVGPAGPAGTAFTHTQSVTSSTWSITHNLGRLPNVTIYIGGIQVEADVSATITTASVSFPSPQSGIAVLS